MSASEIIDAIAAKRRKLGLTMAEAAERAGWERSMWSHAESQRKPVTTVRTLARMADAVDCDLRIRLIQRKKPA